MELFAGYGFNKSHSAGYALVAYQTAWLKRFYPAEFLAASLTSEMSDKDRVMILLADARRLSMRVLPPDVNLSDVVFSVQDGAIRFGLEAVRASAMGRSRRSSRPAPTGHSGTCTTSAAGSTPRA